MKKNGGAVFLVGMVLTLVVANLLLWGLSFAGVYPFEAADNVGVSVFVVVLWSFTWWGTQRRPRPQ